MKITPNISKIRLHSLAAILSRPRLKRSGERRSLLTLLLLIALTAAAFFILPNARAATPFLPDTAPTAALRRMFCVISAA